MAINTSNTVFFKIDPVDFAQYQAESQTPEQTPASPAVKTLAVSQNKDVFVTFLNDSTSEFANAYPCTFEFEGFHYSNASTCVLERLVAASGKETLNDVVMPVLRAKFGQNPMLKDLLLSTGDALLVCQNNDLHSTCLMRLRGEYGGTGIVHLTDLYPDIIHLISSYPDIIHQIFSQCICTSNFKGHFALSCINRYWGQCSKSFWDGLNLKQVGLAGLTILDLETMGFPGVEPKINHAEVLKAFYEIAHHVEGKLGCTLLTMPKDLTLNQLVQIAKDRAITIYFSEDGILKEVGHLPNPSTYVILITNTIFINSRKINDVKKRELLAKHGCEKPLMQEYVALYVLTQRIFGKCLCNTAKSTFGSSSTIFKDHSLFVGGSRPDTLIVRNLGYVVESDGASGRRLFKAIGL